MNGITTGVRIFCEQETAYSKLCHALERDKNSIKENQAEKVDRGSSAVKKNQPGRSDYARTKTEP
jgi:hypothetical protein